MIRVIYEWRVPEGNAAAFRREWSDTTTAIRAAVAGARGSLMLHDMTDPGRILTIARWDSLEDWRTFWRSESHSRMLGLNLLAQRMAVTAYDELADRTELGDCEPAAGRLRPT
jgi:heme-degrading monooxygenase HmoA